MNKLLQTTNYILEVYGNVLLNLLMFYEPSLNEMEFEIICNKIPGYN